MHGSTPWIAAVAALLAITVCAKAQSKGGESLPGQGASPTTANDRDVLDMGVEVSLGRDEIKQRVAKELGIPDAEVPLVVRLPMPVAGRVCGQEDFEARANTNRTCTATSYAPEIAEAVRDHPQTSAVPDQ